MTRPVYVLRFTDADPDALAPADVRLRQLLKRAGRQYGFRCLYPIREEVPDERRREVLPGAPDARPAAPLAQDARPGAVASGEGTGRADRRDARVPALGVGADRLAA